MQDVDLIMSKLSSNKHMPKKLIEYYKNCIKKGKKNRLTQAFQDDLDHTIEAIGEMFKKAADYTGYDPDYILEMTGLSPNDFDEARIDSAFAEVRAINYLGQNKFTNFKLVHDKQNKQSDIVASHNKRKYCIEVTTISTAGKQKWRYDELTLTIFNKFKGEGKEEQLINTLKKERGDRMLLVVVILKEAAKALNDKNDFIIIMKDTLEMINLEELYMSIITGMQTLGVGSDDYFWPEL